MSEYLASVARALRFWSRLPVPALPFEADPHAAPGVAALAPAVPVAGAVIGLVGGLVLAGGVALGLPDAPAAVLAVGALVLATGAMHEDALADVADGFGGGATPAAKLEIMKDPRLGSFGAVALLLAVVLKVELVESLVVEAGVWRAAGCLVGAAALARIVGLWPIVTLPPARGTLGAGAAAGALPAPVWGRGALVGAALALLLGWAATGLGHALLACVAALLAGFGMARLARRQIGGQTGDVCGAATLLADLAYLTVLAAPGS